MYIKKGKISLRPNFKLIPANAVNQDEEGAEIFNKYVNHCKRNNYSHIIRTKSGGISYETIPPAYDVRYTKSIVELTVIDETGCYRLQFRNTTNILTNEDKQIYGSKAFIEFKKILKTHNINLDDYAIDNGEEVKNEIEKYNISMESAFYLNRIIKNAHHIDFHSSFPAGLVNTHPEFKEAITEIYKNRKVNEINKFILNSSIGYMQSVKCCKAKWAHLSRDAINDNNERIRELASRLRRAGCIILAYNTDGIWYTGKIYHGIGEGKELGQWENDHTNCTIRFKSQGSYEYIENGKYTPVVRGATTLDKIKPRDQWEWGDIFNIAATPIKFYLKDELIIWED